MSSVISSTHDDNDPLSKIIGVLTSCIAIVLCIFTICAHRAHSKSLELQNEVNSTWSHYQAKRNREYQTRLDLDLVRIMPSKSAEKSRLIQQYSQQADAYVHELEEIKSEAQHITQRNAVMQQKGLYYNFTEALLEISLILSSFYFISRRRLFPFLGVLLCVIGSSIGIFALWL